MEQKVTVANPSADLPPRRYLGQLVSVNARHYEPPNFALDDLNRGEGKQPQVKSTPPKHLYYMDYLRASA